MQLQVYEVKRQQSAEPCWKGASAEFVQLSERHVQPQPSGKWLYEGSQPA